MSKSSLVMNKSNGQYLETLCDYLYDNLRPRILHGPVLQALLVLDQLIDDETEEEGEKNDELGRFVCFLSLDLL